jgi:hypothetical protein
LMHRETITYGPVLHAGTVRNVACLVDQGASEEAGTPSRAKSFAS